MGYTRGAQSFGAVPPCLLSPTACALPLRLTFVPASNDAAGSCDPQHHLTTHCHGDALPEAKVSELQRPCALPGISYKCFGE
ncbi:hypothetical protein FKM82_017520 [Ascaphus truei]